MVNQAPELLVIDGERVLREFLLRNLGGRGFAVQGAGSWVEVRESLGQGRLAPDVILADPLAICGTNGSQEELRGFCREVGAIPVVILSARRDSRSIVRAIQGGVQDYLCKPFELKDLEETLKRILDSRDLPDRRRVAAKPASLGWICTNSRMRQISQMAERIANTEVPVFLHGESGVGKDVLVRLIHRISDRRERHLVKVNCAALPTELVESELFGHEKGAFTGAHTDRPGKFEFAHGGTIFLDEITEFGPPTQAKLLQVLQDKKFTRLGSNREIEVDVRVVAATNRNIDKAISSGQFREDLFYRLNVVNIEVPPLRQRKDEIEPLSRFFLERFSAEYLTEVPQLPPNLLDAFQGYHWPGNVRELENIVRRFAVLQDVDGIRRELAARAPSEILGEVEEMAEELLAANSGGIDLKAVRRRAAEIVEKSMIRKALRRANWNKSQTAKDLRVSYKTLLSKIEQYEIRP